MFEELANWFKYQKEIFGTEIYHNDTDFNKILDNFANLTETKEELNPTDIFKIDTKPNAKSIDPEWYQSKTLEQLKYNIHNCQECSLSTTRTNFVFGVGNPNAEVMVIGEAPGADEDEQGEPFVGRAGQLLTNMLKAINLEREDVFIANILKCRPTNNRRPTSDEIAQCEPYLQKQIELIKPKIILVLGLTAVSSLLKLDLKMGEIRGTVLDYRGTKLLITYHPEALLRNPNWKKPAWEDLKLLRSMIDEME